MLAQKYLWSITTENLNTSGNWNSGSKKYVILKIMIFMSLWLYFKFCILFNDFSKLNVKSRTENLRSYDACSLRILK